jgi:hypothetical protein
MEVVDLLHHQLFFTANNMGLQPITSHHFTSPILQPLPLAAAAIYCASSEYACPKNAMVRFSQDDYGGTFCPLPVINYTLEATPLIYHCLSHSHSDSQQAPISVHLCWISWIKSNHIGIQFNPLARYEYSANTRSAFSILAQLINCVFMLSFDLMEWEMDWMTWKPCLIGIIWLCSHVIVLVYLRLCCIQLPFSLVP